MTRRKALTVVEDGYEITVQAGDLYKFCYPMRTRAGVVHLPASLLYVVASTKDAPHGEMGPRGVNWMCWTIHGTTNWSTLESVIKRGHLTFFRNAGLKWSPLA